MTKAELVRKIAKEAGITNKAAGLALNCFIGCIHESLKKKDGKIRVSDLGTFKVVKRKARRGINPQTQKKMKIPATKVPRFTPSKALRLTAKKAK